LKSGQNPKASDLQTLICILNKQNSASINIKYDKGSYSVR
jgi:hypothetical protein